MIDPGFEVLERGDGLPVRVRSVFAPYVYFASEAHPITVVVVTETAAKMRACAERNQPTEIGGLLLGRRFRDEAGPYVVVIAALQAPLSDGSPAKIILTPERTSQLRGLAAQEFPSMDVVGWWHSHAYQGGYSAVDFASQNLWSDPMHVGLLVFARDEPWATTYLGPAGIRLTMVKTHNGSSLAAAGMEQGTVAGWPADERVLGGGADRRGPAKWFRGKKSAGARPDVPNRPTDAPAYVPAPGKHKGTTHFSGVDLGFLTVCVVVVLLALSVLLLSAGITNLTYR